MHHEVLTTRNDPARDLTTRMLALRADSVNDADRSVEAVFATENMVNVLDTRTWEIIDEVLRMDGVEIPDHVPLLNNHYRYSIEDVLGSARANPKPTNGQLTGRVYFAEGDGTETADRAWKKAKQGHLRSVSAGYRVLEAVDIPPNQTATVKGKQYTAGQRRLRVATRWQIRELSLVPIGADPAANIRKETPNVNKQLRDYLVTLGMRAEATDQEAIAFLNQLSGEHRTRGDALLTPAPATPPATPPAADTQRQSPPASPPAAPPSNPSNTTVSADEIRRQERDRITGLRTLGGSDVPAELVERSIAEGWDTARAAPVFLQAVRDARTPGAAAGAGAVAGIHVRGQEDASRSVLQAALCLRQGVAIDSQWTEGRRTNARRHLPTWMNAPVNDSQRQQVMDLAHRYDDMSLVDICREAIRLDGAQVPHAREEIIQRAVSGGALSAIFSTAINAELLGAYTETPDSTRSWVDETDVADFKPQERSAMGKFGNLSKHAKGQEADHLDVGDGKESSRIARYSGQFVVDEQDIIDDRFGAIEQLSPAEMGRTAARLRPDLIYAILLANAALDADAVALFHATHANTNTLVLGTAGNLEIAIAAMGKQRIRSATLNVRPRVLIVPQDLTFTADILLNSAMRFDGSGATTAAGVRNPLANRGIMVETDDRIGVAGVTDPNTGTAYAGSATNWFLSAKPGENGAKTLVCKYRRGTGRQPAIRAFVLTQGRWGVGWDINHDIGADADDFRGLYRGNV